MLPKRRFWKTEQKVIIHVASKKLRPSPHDRLLHAAPTCNTTHASMARVLTSGQYEQFPLNHFKNGSYWPDAGVCNSSPFLTNLPFRDFPKMMNHESWLKYLGKSWKGRFVKKGDELHTPGLMWVLSQSMWETTLASVTHVGNNIGASYPRRIGQAH